MATYEDIAKANESIKTTDIKGKEYAEVNQRVKAFRMVYPEGAISTHLVSLENGVCVFKAAVYSSAEYVDEEYNSMEGIYPEQNLLATGYAYEKEGSSFINKTSFIENCETSAIGRALGFCGFGIDTSIASYEEVANAKMNQGEERDMYKERIMTYVGAWGLDANKVFKKVKINGLDELPTDRMKGMLDWLNSLDEAKRKELK